MEATAPPVEDWFWEWLPIHQRLCPHRGWKEYESAEGIGKAVFRGWILALEAAHITKELAYQTSRAMQASLPGFPEHHLAAFLETAREIRRKHDIAEGERRRALERAAARQEEAERDRLRERWGQLAEKTRARIRAEVLAANPGAAATPKFLELLCLETLREGARTTTRRKVPA